MFDEVAVGDEVGVEGILYQVVRVSQSRFWVQMGRENVKFSRKNGREYGGHRQAELPLFDEEPVHILCDSDARTVPLVDLLAGLLQTPDAHRLAGDILGAFDSLTSLRRATVLELAQVIGSIDLANRVKAAIEFSRRLLEAQDVIRPRVTSPADAANLVMHEMRDLRVENMRLVLLDTRNNVLATPTVYIGSINTISVRFADLFRRALEYNATALILVHNHPSGDPSPSPEDVSTTRDFVKAGKVLGIDVLDHLIIGDGRYVSLKEKGLGFE